MKALTISQPYASLIASGEKWIENRHWTTQYRGPLAIHAGKGNQYMDTREMAAMPTGCVIAIAELVGCLPLDILRKHRSSQVLDKLGVSVDEFLANVHAEGPWCWVLQGARRIKPIAARGQQGIWTFYPPNEGVVYEVNQPGERE